MPPSPAQSQARSWCGLTTTVVPGLHEQDLKVQLRRGGSLVRETYWENVVIPSASTSLELQRVLDWFETRLLEVRSHGVHLETGGIPSRGQA